MRMNSKNNSSIYPKTIYNFSQNNHHFIQKQFIILFKNNLSFYSKQFIIFLRMMKILLFLSFTFLFNPIIWKKRFNVIKYNNECFYKTLLYGLLNAETNF